MHLTEARTAEQYGLVAAQIFLAISELRHSAVMSAVRIFLYDTTYITKMVKAFR